MMNVLLMRARTEASPLSVLVKWVLDDQLRTIRQRRRAIYIFFSHVLCQTDDLVFRPYVIISQLHI